MLAFLYLDGIAASCSYIEGIPTDKGNRQCLPSCVPGHIASFSTPVMVRSLPMFMLRETPKSPSSGWHLYPCKVPVVSAELNLLESIRWSGNTNLS